MRMLHKNLLIKQLSKEQLGKVILPDVVEDDWLRVKVINVGPAVESGIEVDDIIIFPPAPPHLGAYPTIGEKGYVIISDNMALGIED